MAGEIGMGQIVPVAGAVAPAVGDVFEDRRHGVLLGVFGHPDAGGELDAIRERDPEGFDFPNLLWECRDHRHSPKPPLSLSFFAGAPALPTKFYIV